MKYQWYRKTKFNDPFTIMDNVTGEFLTVDVSSFPEPPLNADTDIFSHYYMCVLNDTLTANYAEVRFSTKEYNINNLYITNGSDNNRNIEFELNTFVQLANLTLTCNCTVANTDGLTYEWKIDGLIQSSNQTNQLIINNLPSNDIVNITCTVSNKYYSKTAIYKIVILNDHIHLKVCNTNEYVKIYAIYKNGYPSLIVLPTNEPIDIKYARFNLLANTYLYVENINDYASIKFTSKIPAESMTTPFYILPLFSYENNILGNVISTHIVNISPITIDNYTTLKLTPISI